MESKPRAIGWDGVYAGSDMHLHFSPQWIDHHWGVFLAKHSKFLIPTTLTTYADSAASDHFFIDISDFELYEPYTRKSGSTAKNSRSFTICGKGNVRKCCIYNGRVITLLFKDALHCPTLSHNLIAIKKLNAGGCYAVFRGGGLLPPLTQKVGPSCMERGKGWCLKLTSSHQTAAHSYTIWQHLQTHQLIFLWHSKHR